MSTPFSSEHFARIRHDARGMVERTRDHEGRLNALVETAEDVARHATVLSEAIDAKEMEHLCVEQVRRSAENAQATVRAYVSAREQHAAAYRNWTRLDDGTADAHEGTASPGTAVLVVDDVEDVRDLLAVVLSAAGFAVRTAVNGLEGLLAAYDMRPRVIVMDLTMPVLNGFEATRLIKATDAIRESKIIAYTANDSIPPPLARWFVAIVRKPSPPDVVLAAVQNAAAI